MVAVVVDTRDVVGGAVAGMSARVVHPPMRAAATNTVRNRWYRILGPTLRNDRRGSRGPEARFSRSGSLAPRAGGNQVRRTIIGVAALLLAMAVYLVNFGFWVQQELLDEDAFVASALDSFAVEGSPEALADIVAGKMIAEYPAAIVLGPALSSLLTNLLVTDAFQPALVEVAEDLHVRLTGGETSAIVIDLAPHEENIMEAIASAAPGLVDLVPDGLFRTYTVFDAGEVPNAAGGLQLVELMSLLAVMGAIVLVGIIAFVGRSIASIFGAVGLALLLGGAVGLLLVPLGGNSIGLLTSNASYEVLGNNLFDVLIDSLAGRSLSLIIVGAAMFAIALIARWASHGDPQT